MATPETAPGAFSEAYAPFTPFEESYAFEPEAPPGAELEGPLSASLVTPFVSEYAGELSEASLEATEIQQFLAELYDSELDEALTELAQEAASAAADRAEQLGEVETEATSEQFLDEWMRPAREQAEQMLDSIAEAVTQQDVASMSESELEAFFDRFEPRETGLEAHFEGFLGGLWRKIKKGVSGIVGLAKKGLAFALKAIPGLGLLLRKLKGLVRPLLNRVLRMALDRLPAVLRPHARRLAERILGAVGSEVAGEENEQPAVPEVSSLQEAFDLQFASLLSSSDEAEQEVIVSEAAAEDREQEAPIVQLLEARERLVDELERGQSPEQALENFIPVVMAALPIARTVIGLIGRSNVVNFLARFLARLVERYVDPNVASQLSQAIVDTGLRMISLEAPTPDETRRLAPEAIVGAVEDTIRRVASFDETTMEHPALFEAAVTEAFHEAAAENFPSQLLVPDVHEVSGVRGTWVFMPRRGRRKYYKKYTHVFDVEVTPQMAASVRTFGGITLAAFLKDQLGVTAPVRARVHLYQATHGTWLSRITRFERGVPGLGSGSRRAWSQLHPLTPRAAGILLQQPRLGRKTSGRFRTGRGYVAVGQRFYYLEIGGARSTLAPSLDGTAIVRRSSRVNVTLDFPKDEFRIFVYLSESDAQEIAAHLRKRDMTSALLLARRVYTAAVRTALDGDIRKRVKVIGETSQEQFLGGALSRVAESVREHLITKVVSWLGKGVADYLATRSSEFITATENRADGVTIVVRMANPPGAPLVRRILRGEAVSASMMLDLPGAFRGEPKLSVTTVAGFRFD
jgi:hypothetical protein